MWAKQTVHLQLIQIIDRASAGVWVGGRETTGYFLSQEILGIPIHIDWCTDLLEPQLPSLAGLLC